MIWWALETFFLQSLSQILLAAMEAVPFGNSFTSFWCPILGRKRKRLGSPFHSHPREGRCSAFMESINVDNHIVTHSSCGVYRALCSIKNAVRKCNPHLDAGKGNRLQNILSFVLMQLGLRAKYCKSFLYPKLCSHEKLRHQKQEESSQVSSATGIISQSEFQCQVKRLLSWSSYLETTGGEGPVESAEEWMIDMSQLFLGHTFASGRYSRLYHGIYKQKEVAVKVMNRSEDGQKVFILFEQFSREVALLSHLRHFNIVEFIAACKKPPLLCVITEYLPGGSLRTFLHKQGPHSLSLQVVVSIALDIARGMKYLHSQGVIHRDLKSENLVLTDDLHVKVADFGISCLESQWDNMKGFMGTYRWMAPEMINKKPCSRKVDVYSFGIVLWEILTGLVPYEEMTPVQAAYAVVQKNYRPTIPADCPSELSKLMQECWCANPAKRPEFSHVVKWLEQYQKLT
eukprot:c27389_g1_i1 orf=411-1784(+)